MSTSTSWKKLFNEIEHLYNSGNTCGDAVSESGKPVLFFKHEMLGSLSQWISAAHVFAMQTSNATVASDLTKAVERAVPHKNIHEVQEQLLLSDFETEYEVQEIRRYRDDEDGPVFGYTKCGARTEESDPLETKYRLQCLVEDLVAIAKLACGLQITLSAEDQTKEFWTREEAARYSGITPESLSKQITQHRREHNGADPIWVRRKPGMQRGFLVHVDTYKAELLARRRSYKK